MPCSTLFFLSETYAKFGVKVGDQVAFTFDVSSAASLWNVAVDDAAEGGEALGMYQVVSAAKYREQMEIVRQAFPTFAVHFG
jgi:hypothetical protein